jgi:hypothetical protein
LCFPPLPILFSRTPNRLAAYPQGYAYHRLVTTGLTSFLALIETTICLFIYKEIPQNTSRVFVWLIIVFVTLTPRRGALLEKLLVLQLVKNFPTFYGIQSFMLQDPFTVTYPELDQSNSYHPIPSACDRFLVLFTHLQLGIPSGHLPSGVPINILYAFFMLFPSRRPWLDQCNYSTWGRVQVMKFHIIQFFKKILLLRPSSAQTFSS